MNKSELVVLLKEHFGIPLEEKKKGIQDIREIKTAIKQLKEQRTEALNAKDPQKATVLRYKIKKLKRKTRRLA